MLSERYKWIKLLSRPRDQEKPEKAPGMRWPLAPKGCVGYTCSYGGRHLKWKSHKKARIVGVDFGMFWTRSERSPMEKQFNSPLRTMWVMSHDSLATKSFPGKGLHFLKGQAAGQWMSTKAFLNLASRSEYAMVSPRELCSTKDSPKDSWETLRSP